MWILLAAILSFMFCMFSGCSELIVFQVGALLGVIAGYMQFKD